MRETKEQIFFRRWYTKTSKQFRELKTKLQVRENEGKDREHKLNDEKSTIKSDLNDK